MITPFGVHPHTRPDIAQGISWNPDRTVTVCQGIPDKKMDKGCLCLRFTTTMLQHPQVRIQLPQSSAEPTHVMYEPLHATPWSYVHARGPMLGMAAMIIILAFIAGTCLMRALDMHTIARSKAAKKHAVQDKKRATQHAKNINKKLEKNQNMRKTHET